MSDENIGDSAVIAVSRGGRPTKYEPETIDRLLAAIADGLTQKQACIATGICENTLSNWREKHPELESRLEQARESARQKALAGIKQAGEAGDWRALEAFLRMSFPADYRRDASISVTATAVAAQQQVVSEEQRQRLIKLLQEQQRQSALAQRSALAAAARQLPSGAQPGWKPENRPIISVDASHLSAALKPAADQDPGGLAEGWGLNHPELL